LLIYTTSGKIEVCQRLKSTTLKYIPGCGDDPHLHLRQMQVSTSLRTDRAPIVLIHGSKIDRGDWDEVAPELVKHYKVFTPVCRGHGKSNTRT